MSESKLFEIEQFIGPQSRWRSKAAWISLVSFILLALKLIFKIEVPYADLLINSLFGVLTAFGIFNNPTDSNNY
jgi:uncharacterized membrane protein